MISQPHQIDMSKTIYRTVLECILLSNVHGTYIKIDHIMSHEQNLQRLKLCSIYSHITVELNYKSMNVSRKSPTVWKLSKEHISK